MSLTAYIYLCITLSHVWLVSTVKDDSTKKMYAVLWLVAAFLGLVAHLFI